MKKIETNKGEIMAEVFGTITVDGITFEAGYRTEDVRNQGGYERCLKLYGKGHEYFGDDKYEVKKMTKCDDHLLLDLDYALVSSRDRNKIDFFELVQRSKEIKLIK